MNFINKIKSLFINNKVDYDSYLTNEERRDLQGLIRLNRIIDPNRNCWFTSVDFISNPPTKDKYLYQRIKFRDKIIPIHRLSAIAFLSLNSENPKWRVCHKCDVPACFNPDHLFIGTDSDNFKDSQSKGRSVKFKFISKRKVINEKVRLELKAISDKVDLERNIPESKARAIGKKILESKEDNYFMSIEECNKILGKSDVNYK